MNAHVESTSRFFSLSRHPLSLLHLLLQSKGSTFHCLFLAYLIYHLSLLFFSFSHSTGRAGPKSDCHFVRIENSIVSISFRFSCWGLFVLFTRRFHNAIIVSSFDDVEGNSVCAKRPGQVRPICHAMAQPAKKTRLSLFRSNGYTLPLLGCIGIFMMILLRLLLLLFFRVRFGITAFHLSANSIETVKRRESTLDSTFFIAHPMRFSPTFFRFVNVIADDLTTHDFDMWERAPFSVDKAATATAAGLCPIKKQQVNERKKKDRDQPRPFNQIRTSKSRAPTARISQLHDRWAY